MPQTLHRNALGRIFWAVWGKLWWLFGIVFIGGFFLLASKNPALLVRLFGLLFIFSGLAMLVYVAKMRRQQRQSRSWVPVQGRVLSSEVKKEIHRSRFVQGSPLTWGGITTYFPRVEYAYQYQGKTYQAKGIITININWPKKEAEAAVARYPVDASVTVWVNPDLPHQAVLETGMGHYAKKYKLAFFISVAFLIAGTTGWFIAPLLHK